MCCNFRGCIGFVIGVIIALGISALTAFGVFSGAFTLAVTGYVIVAIAALLILIASLYGIETGCCRADERILCAIKNCILTVIITGIIAIILTIVIQSLAALTAVVAGILAFFLVLAFIVEIIAFISLFVCRVSDCDDDSDFIVNCR